MKIRVLIVDGFSHHDWQATTQLIREVLAVDAQICVEVATIPAQDSDNWGNWLP